MYANVPFTFVSPPRFNTAVPKSLTLARPSRNSTFSGLRSRCTMRLPCRYATAPITSHSIDWTCSAERSPPCAMSSLSDPSEQSSMKMDTQLSSRSQKRYCTMLGWLSELMISTSCAISLSWLSCPCGSPSRSSRRYIRFTAQRAPVTSISASKTLPNAPPPRRRPSVYGGTLKRLDGRKMLTLFISSSTPMPEKSSTSTSRNVSGISRREAYGTSTGIMLSAAAKKKTGRRSCSSHDSATRSCAASRSGACSSSTLKRSDPRRKASSRASSVGRCNTRKLELHNMRRTSSSMLLRLRQYMSAVMARASTPLPIILSRITRDEKRVSWPEPWDVPTQPSAPRKEPWSREPSVGAVSVISLSSA
ncbi:hypothetical protein DQ04_10661000 [Trypanosoma grayi]|uniref:hypothetical protein n=1 Tax=Trypanosoma grayi TaxID=71804 RepID=UPI0004F43CD7|nr:hypothetical protein DQ04_10661000 [Trypanosoma grayi]KEG07169.1 hypothetical protein DQ04_10661000 [Trypanosoma grayi]